MLIPNTSAFPDVGLSKPVSMESVVVLPAPLCPSSANIYPLYIVKFVPFTAFFGPNSFTSPLTLRHCPVTSYLFNASATGSKFLGFYMSFASSSSLSGYISSVSILLSFLHLQQKFHGFATPNSVGST